MEKLKKIKLQNTTKPPNWSKNPCEVGGFENVDFIVWMRTAALPYFKKLWRIVDRTTNPLFSNGLPQGTYILTVENSKHIHRREFYNLGVNNTIVHDQKLLKWRK